MRASRSGTKSCGAWRCRQRRWRLSRPPISARCGTSCAWPWTAADALPQLAENRARLGHRVVALTRACDRRQALVHACFHVEEDAKGRIAQQLHLEPSHPGVDAARMKRQRHRLLQSAREHARMRRSARSLMVLLEEEPARHPAVNGLELHLQ